jgi:peptidoglycan/LPS O-acetylase OafA/YrhL
MVALETKGALPASSMRGRVHQLDSLRGLAAVTVVCHHWDRALWANRPSWPLIPLVSGYEAVILFFVLSGYVLSLPVWRERQPPYPEYLVRRVCRIYLPYLAALALAIVGCYFFGNSLLPLTPWFYETWHTPLSPQLIFRQILMDPGPQLNTAFWSLRYEMEMSLIFPFVCMLMLRTGRYSGIFLILAIKAVSHVLLGSRFGQSHWMLTLSYSEFFIAGATIARAQEPLKRLVSRMSQPLLWITLTLTVITYFYIASFSNNAGNYEMVAVCCLIILIQDPRMHLGLQSRAAEYLGRISYSSYLVHGTVLFTLLSLLYGKIPLAWLAVIYGAATLVISHLFCVFLEEPSQRLGRRIGTHMRERR